MRDAPLVDAVDVNALVTYRILPALPRFNSKLNRNLGCVASHLYTVSRFIRPGRASFALIDDILEISVGHIDTLCKRIQCNALLCGY